MIANFHTHTWRCNHAGGTERQYVEKALEAGLWILGFSDHAPYVFPRGYHSNFRMTLEQLPGYVETVLALREEYAGKIEIPLGLELEYYPKLFPKLLPILRDYPLDYAILGQHFIDNEYDAPYAGLNTGDKAVLEAYCSQSRDAMQTGSFTYFAHPDLMNYHGDRKLYQHHMTLVCREAKQCGIPLEYNLLGLRGGRHYPNPYFWEVAAEEGCDVILGRDAHDPDALCDVRTEELALSQLSALGIKPLEKTALRKI